MWSVRRLPTRSATKRKVILLMAYSSDPTWVVSEAKGSEDFLVSTQKLRWVNTSVNLSQVAPATRLFLLCGPHTPGAPRGRTQRPPPGERGEDHPHQGGANRRRDPGREAQGARSPQGGPPQTGAGAAHRQPPTDPERRAPGDPDPRRGGGDNKKETHPTVTSHSH